MIALKAAFEKAGFKNIVTYIQSGNVIFESSINKTETLTKKIEKELSQEFNYQSKVVVISPKQLEKVVKKAPKGFGQKPDKYRSDVIFLKPPCTPAQAIKEVSTREGVDRAFAGDGVLYFDRLTAEATKSHLSKIVMKPIYKSMTIRNWNTTTKLLALMEKSKE